jgi:hypothetical protein
MNRYVITYVNGDQYEIHLRGSTIVHIIRHDNSNRVRDEVSYDELNLHIREEILIAIIQELAK